MSNRRRRSLRQNSTAHATMGGSKNPRPRRTRPNVLITGTPGTGKSSLAERVAAAAGMTQYDVSKIAKAENLCESYDEAMDTHVIDEDNMNEVSASYIVEGANLPTTCKAHFALCHKGVKIAPGSTALTRISGP